MVIGYSNNIKWIYLPCMFNKCDLFPGVNSSVLLFSFSTQDLAEIHNSSFYNLTPLVLWLTLKFTHVYYTIDSLSNTYFPHNMEVK